MKVIGVTGPIGSGKSTVSRILSEAGAFIIDADKIAKEVVCKGKKAYQELIDYFGRGILNPEEELDRKKLAAIVFGDNEKLQAINGIVHKYVVEEIIEQIDKLMTDKSNDLVVLDVPIPVKHGFIDIADEIWVVTADKETRISRIMKRNGFDREEALRRINAQMSEEEYLKLADHVILNNGSEKQLGEKIRDLLKRI